MFGSGDLLTLRFDYPLSTMWKDDRPTRRSCQGPAMRRYVQVLIGAGHGINGASAQALSRQEVTTVFRADRCRLKSGEMESGACADGSYVRKKKMYRDSRRLPAAKAGDIQWRRLPMTRPNPAERVRRPTWYERCLH